MTTTEIIMEAARRGAGVAGDYRRNTQDLYRSVDEERAAISKRARELRAQDVPNAAEVARKEFADAHAKRHADRRERVLRSETEAIQERDSREARAKYWAEKAEEPVYEPKPGDGVNVVHQARSRDRVAEKLMAQLHHLRENA